MNSIACLGSALTAFLIFYVIRADRESRPPAEDPDPASTVLLRHTGSAGGGPESAPFAPETEPAGFAMARRLVVATADDFPQLLAETEGLPWSERNFTRQLVFSRWLEVDPGAAFSAAQMVESHERNSRVGNLLFREWVRIDPDAALEACLALPKNMATTGLLAGAMELGPENYLRLLARLPENAVRSPPGLDRMFATLAAADRAAALERAAGLPEKYQGLALQGIAKAWIANDPAGAVEWATSLAGGKTRDQVLGAVLSTFCLRAAGAA